MSVISVVFSSEQLLSLCVSLLTVLAITLIFKTQTTTNFAQTTIATAGAYLVAKLVQEAKFSIWVAFPIGLAVCLLLGLFIDTCVIRRGRAVNAVGKQIITMGFTYVVLSIILVALQIHDTSGAIIQVNPSTTFFDTMNADLAIKITDTFGYHYNTIFCFGFTAIVLIVLFVCIYKTKWGLGVRMTASNETVAQMVGVNTHVITAISWSIAAMLGCMAAVFINTTPGKLSTSMMSAIQISAFLGCIVGGFNTFWGPAVATLIIWSAGGVINALSTVPGLGGIGTWKDVIVYAIAMILVLIKPAGLFGKAVRKKV